MKGIKEKVRINPWPYGHVVAVVIRDDDINYFTPPYKIEKLYKNAYKEGFNLSLGIIPNVKAIDDLYVPPKYRKIPSRFYKICQNKELVTYLKEKLASHQVDIAQHGYTHENLYGKPEFYINNPSEIRKRLTAGRAILEKCLPAKISVFIPPRNLASKQTWKILKKEELALSRKERISNIFKNTPWSLSKIIALMKIFTQLKNRHPLAAGILRFSGMVDLHYTYWHKSLATWSLTSTYSERIKWAREKFMKIIRMNGLFCILNHWWEYYGDWQSDINDEEMLNSFYDLLNFLDTYNIWKTTLSRAVNWIKKLDKIKVVIKKGEIALESPTTIEGLTIKGEKGELIPADNTDVEVKNRGNTVFLVFKKLEAGKRKVAFID